MSQRAAIYARVSTDEQTVEPQVHEAKELAVRRGWTVAATFEDIGWSGARGRRPGLDAMLEQARRRRFDVLLVWRADRLFRSVPHMVATLGELAALGIDFVSCTESFDTSTPTGRLLFHLCAAFGQFERDVAIERTKAGMASAQRRGARIGRPRARVDVERALELRAAGRSLRQVAAELGVGLATLQRALERSPATAVLNDSPEP